MKNQQSSLETPEQLRLRNSYSARKGRYGIYLGPVVWAVSAVIRAFSFSVQVVLRKGIGSYSHGITTVLLSLLLLRFFAVKDFDFHPLDEEFAVFTVQSQLEPSELDEALRPVYVAGNYTVQALGNLALLPSFVNLKAPYDGSKILWYYSYLFVLLVLFEFFFDLFKSDSEDRPSLESRGRSRFLGRLINPGVKVGFKKNRHRMSWTLKASRPAVRFLAEPVLILLFAAVSYLFGGLNLALFLFFAACSLAWEEYKYHKYYRKVTNTGVSRESTY